MGGPWSASTERKLLLCMIDPKATPRWQLIAQAMGPQFSAEACRQKYYKLRNESAKLLDDQPGSVPSTPTKRKALKSEDETKTPPSKRARKPKRDPLDGELFSDAGSSPTEAKTNNVTPGATNTFQNYHEPFIPTDFFLPMNNQFKVGGSGSGSGSGSGNHSFPQ
ncbi:hypothetical protein HRR83_005856 [Exophiala dermatitidis]|uniref:Myb-like domain-containing protein n=2 Tax=Exophiala dermatitidis TaxID=5970 RepID=H6BUK9_EXODN|nr:hypothetical protein, variant [Exophiala dermatitidis NIH/UT8656]KAJ4513411.1 hypothetical protein HRR74_006225 [Exophiala dermatitidis]EHY54884.1 hypothetical protein, variant [Exophiala dermatitidis NIH/UT8656]KAJ4538035.1 hypothetical protein HRR77_007075 [Exophiala dermatitidis]KAJ4539766.1 hypothetical protein HRR76_003202 [Exophiala dermatitidis]KAJ4562326.1 hypothetical protein HRR79_006653 [Exophiala dermatitidis]